MIRKIIKIDQELCNGCGICASACHEGAIDIIDGKAQLVREHYCDGLGDCLPACPTGAIRFEEREAPAYDEAAVKAAQAAKRQESAGQASHGAAGQAGQEAAGRPGQGAADSFAPASQLRQWPVQIKLAPVKAPYFAQADLLIAADCTAYAYGDFHSQFMKNRVTLIGCPKLDMVDYAEKLTQIFRENEIRSVVVTRMVVPCCGGIEMAVKRAIEASQKQIPCQTVTISTEGMRL